MDVADGAAAALNGSRIVLAVQAPLPEQLALIPHGALLMADFILSPEGQKILEDLQFGSPSKDFGFKRWYPETGGTLAQYEEALEGWHKLLKEVTRK